MANTSLTLNALNERQSAFVLEYLKDRNATQAYIRAGYAARGATATVNASQLLKLPKVAAQIELLEAEALKRIQERVAINLEATLVSIARSAMYDPRKLFHPDGRPKDINELDDDTAMAIEGIEVVEQYQGSGEERVFTGYVKRYKMARRSAAQDMLMKHLNGYNADNDSKGAGVANALAELLGSMRRSALPIVPQVADDELV